MQIHVIIVIFFVVTAISAPTFHFHFPLMELNALESVEELIAKQSRQSERARCSRGKVPTKFVSFSIAKHSVFCIFCQKNLYHSILQCIFASFCIHYVQSTSFKLCTLYIQPWIWKIQEKVDSQYIELFLKFNWKRKHVMHCNLMLPLQVTIRTSTSTQYDLLVCEKPTCSYQTHFNLTWQLHFLWGGLKALRSMSI